MAGQPMRMQALQPTHLSAFTENAGWRLTVFKSAHGRRLMITDGASAASSSLMTASHSARLYGSTTRTRSNPMARQRASRSILPAGSPLMLYPVVGFCWWPVMPVIELSRMITVELLWL